MASYRVFACVLCAYICSAAPHGGVGDAGSGFLASPGRSVSLEEVTLTLQESLTSLLGGDSAGARRLASIEGSIWQTYQALPKNAMGRLAPRAVRHIVRSYFAREHGWLIKGLEPHGMKFFGAEVHEVNILQDKAPDVVEALLESRHADHGLALEDVAVMVAAMERLIFDESLTLLNASYDLNGASASSEIDETSLHEVLTTYLLVFGQGAGSDLTDVGKHQAIKDYLRQTGSSGWSDLVEFEQDTVWNYDFARRQSVNPFEVHSYSFQEVSHMVEDMTQGYGRWQDAECRQMKSALMDLAPDGSGRVPLGTFYSQPPSALYQFTESVEYLRDTGALDETKSEAPSVRIANYLLGPSNCIASSSYYSICCLSECEGLVNELEAKVMAPEASPEQLRWLVGNLSSSTVEAPWILPATLTDRLYGIAANHRGSVPLHGRLFMEWMHYTYPNECPYPSIVEKETALTQSHWEEQKPMASEEDKSLHIEAGKTFTKVEDESELHWSDDEVLPVQDARAGGGFYAVVVRPAIQIVMLVVIFRAALAAWKTATRAQKGGNYGKKGDDAFDLPSYC